MAFIFLYLPISLKGVTNDSLQIGSQKYYEHISHLFRSNNHSELSYWLQKAEKHGKLKKDTALLITTYQNYARRYFDKQDLDLSVSYMQKSYKLASSYADTTMLTRAIILLGTMHSYAGDDSLALHYFVKAENINKVKPNEDIIDALYVNLALAYKKTNQFDKALLYLEKSKKSIDTTNIAHYSVYHLNASSIYVGLKQYDLAQYHAQQAMLLKTKLNDQRGIARATMSLGIAFAKAEKPKFAVTYFLDAVKLGLELSEPTLEMEAYEELEKSYTNLQLYKHALDANRNYHRIKDSIDKTTAQKEISELRAISTLREKNLNLKKEAENKQQIESSLETQKKINYILLAFVATAVFLSAFIILTFRQKERFAALLAQRNKEYQAMNIKLKNSNAAKDKFMSILAHDMINPFNAFLMVTQFLQRSYDELDKDEIKESINDISESARGLYNLLENLLKWGRSQTGRINFAPDFINLDMIVCSTMSILKNNAQVKKIKLTSDIPESLEVYVDPNMITTVIRNLMSNAIKFTPSGGQVRVEAYYSKPITTVSVIDTGMGISEEDIKKLFDLSTHHSTLGTSNEKGTGLGLILCKDFVEKHGGKIWVESQKGKGSTFTFTIPDKN